MNYDGLSRKNIFVAEALESIEKNKPTIEKIEKDIIRLKKKEGVGWKQLYYRLSYKPLKKLIVSKIFNNIEPTYKQRFVKKYWKYPSSLSFRNKYSEDVQNQVIQAFRDMSPDDIENGNHPNISLCSNLKDGEKKIFKWKKDGVRIAYGTIKRDHYLNVIFFDSSDMKTTGEHSHSKDKNDIHKFQDHLKNMEKRITEQGIQFEDSADSKIRRISIDQLFESVGFVRIDNFDEEFVRRIVESNE